MSFIRAGPYTGPGERKKRREKQGTQKQTGVDTEVIHMSPRYERSVAPGDGGPEHYYGHDQSSFYNVYRELTRAKVYSLPEGLPGSPGKVSPFNHRPSSRPKPSPYADVLAGDEVELRYADLNALTTHDRGEGADGGGGDDDDEDDPFGRRAALEQDRELQEKVESGAARGSFDVTST